MKDLKFSGNGEKVIDFLERIPDQFIVTKKELDQEQHGLFMAALECIDPQPDYAALLRQGKKLSDNTLPLSQKKTILVQLACQGTTEAYQLLQRYCTHPDLALEQWSRIALYECQMRLEQEMLDAPVGLISTGLGGDGERLRYIFILAFLEESLWDEQQQKMQEVLHSICRQYRSFVEEVLFRPACLYVQVLVPLDIAVGKVIEKSIILLNQKDELVWPDYRSPMFLCRPRMR